MTKAGQWNYERIRTNGGKVPFSPYKWRKPVNEIMKEYGLAEEKHRLVRTDVKSKKEKKKAGQRIEKE